MKLQSMIGTMRLTYKTALEQVPLVELEINKLVRLYLTTNMYFYVVTQLYTTKYDSRQLHIIINNVSLNTHLLSLISC